MPFTAIDWTAHAGDADGMVGAEVIQTLVKRLPNAPGVYRMMNAAGDVLYVGKARSLKKRVTNYAQGRFHTNRIGRMVRETATMEFVVTRTEIEALLLEANLIKRLRPRFNVLMRDDKSFPYIVLTGDHPSPGIFKHRGARSRKGDYFGPFASAGAVGRTINSLQRAFLLRTCTDSVFESRTRPCLLYQIKRCSGPCTGEISAPDYAELVEEAKDFLSGRSQKVKTEISAQMQQAAEDLDFERAAIYRDRLAALSHVQSHQGINPQGVEEADVFAIHQEGGQVCIQVFFFRTGQNWGNRAYFPKADPALEAAEVLVVLPRPVLRRQAVPALDPACRTRSRSRNCWRQALATSAGHKVSITGAAARREEGSRRPRRAERPRGAGPQAGRNVDPDAAACRLRRDLRAGKAAAPHRGLRQLAHHGHQCRRRDDRLRAGRLREEPVPQVQHPLDRHHAGRRFRHDARGDGTALLAADQGAWRGAGETRPRDDDADECGLPGLAGRDPDRRRAGPDDGGALDPARISASRIASWRSASPRARTARPAASASSPRARGRSRCRCATRCSISCSGCATRRIVSPSARTARGARRRWCRNPLDEISGIGPGRKRALLLHFGTAKAVSNAAMDDLMAVDGISESVARLVYNHFHEN